MGTLSQAVLRVPRVCFVHVRYYLFGIWNFSTLAVGCSNIFDCGPDDLASSRGGTTAGASDGVPTVVVSDGIDLLAKLLGIGASRHALDHVHTSDLGASRAHLIGLPVRINTDTPNFGFSP